MLAQGPAGRHKRWKQSLDIMQGGDCILVLIRRDIFCRRNCNPRYSAVRTIRAVFKLVTVLFTNSEEIIRGKGTLTNRIRQFTAVTIQFVTKRIDLEMNTVLRRGTAAGMLDTPFKLTDDLALLCFLAVEFKTETGKTRSVQTPFNHFKCSHLF